jgi:hypothetical protein
LKQVAGAMGLGPQILELYRQLKILGALEGTRNVIELGSQDFWCPQQNVVRALFSAFARPEPPPELLHTTNAKQLPARLLYEALGLDYQCVDVDGRDGSLTLDFNFDSAPSDHSGRYDLVTNHGTSEHLLNQYNVFKMMHDFAKVRGIMVHAVPFTVHLEHGFFNYQPNFFESLARYNSYEILGLWVGPDWQLTSLVPWQPALLDFMTLSSKTTHLLVAVLRKLHPRDFCVPFQAIYEDRVPDETLNRYSVTIDGESTTGARIKHLTHNDLLAPKYLKEIETLMVSISACRDQIAGLEGNLSNLIKGRRTFWQGRVGSIGEQDLQQVLAQVAGIKSQLEEATSTSVAVGPDQEFVYASEGTTAAIIPLDAQNVRRNHGASILSIPSQHNSGAASQLYCRASLNCYCSENNSVVIAIFRDDVDRPVVLEVEPLTAGNPTVVDKKFAIPLERGSAAPNFEVRVGLAREGGVLFLNHEPTKKIFSTPSRIVVRSFSRPPVE